MSKVLSGFSNMMWASHEKTKSLLKFTPTANEKDSKKKAEVKTEGKFTETKPVGSGPNPTPVTSASSSIRSHS